MVPLDIGRSGLRPGKIKGILWVESVFNRVRAWLESGTLCFLRAFMRASGTVQIDFFWLISCLVAKRTSQVLPAVNMINRSAKDPIVSIL